MTRTLMLSLFFAACASTTAPTPTVVVGSLKDIEGSILGEVIAQTIEATGECAVQRELGLGGTGLLFEAFAAGRIDLAPQYSATLARVVLKKPELTDFHEISKAVRAQFDLGQPLGFNNTYGIGVRREVAERFHLKTIDDLRGKPWRGAVSSEFFDSEYGLSGLARVYGLELGPTKTMEHVLSYVALEAGEVDFVDVYTTDAAISHHELVVLTDTRGFFPKYEGVVLARAGFAQKCPRSWASLGALAGSMTDATMVKLNTEVEIHHRNPADVAREWLNAGRAPAVGQVQAPSVVANFLTWTMQHLLLVGVSLVLALLFGIPLGIWAGHRPRAGKWVLLIVGVVQTIPGVALLCFFIPLMGIGTVPAVAALTLYALLPIVQGIVTGLKATTSAQHEVAAVLGMTARHKLTRIEIPLALPALIAGVRVAAVTTVGTAALAAFIGAGGYGTPIAKGLARADWGLVLQGALPSAVLAIMVHAIFLVGWAVAAERALFVRHRHDACLSSS